MRLAPLAPVFLAIAIVAAAPALADDMVRKTSPQDVPTTVGRLEDAFQGTNIKVIARVDHAAAAAEAGLELRPTVLLIFGNPEHGTPLMQQQQSIGLDLPMRVLVYEDADGKTQVVYHEPAALAEAHGIDSDNEMIQKMTMGLDKLTDKATAGQ